MNLSVSQEVRATLQVYGKENAGDINKGKLKEIPYAPTACAAGLHSSTTRFALASQMEKDRLPFFFKARFQLSQR